MGAQIDINIMIKIIRVDVIANLDLNNFELEEFQGQVTDPSLSNLSHVILFKEGIASDISLKISFG